MPVWKKLLFAVITCGGFLLCLELLLACFGVRPVLYGEDPYVGFSSRVPLFVRQRDRAGETMLVTASNKVRFFNPQQFTLKKAQGTYRIFCLGGSTTYGHPYDDRTSFCGWLRAMLPRADPARRWEVINCGGISYASYRIAVLMEELVAYQPDLFIIYNGENEFLEQRTYADIIAMPGALRGVGALLSRTRVHSAARTIVDQFAGRSHQPAPTRATLPAEVETMLDRVVGPQAYTRDEHLQTQVLDHYRFNLQRMISMARSVGAGVVFVTPASNLRDCAPFKSENRPGLTEAEAQRWQTFFQRAAASHAGGQWTPALGAADEALAIDDRFAALHFLRGRILWELQRFVEAKAAFIRARDEDICPLRALTPVRDIVTGVAAEQRATVVDFVRLVDELADHGIPGEDWFLDHVHPTIEGNRRLALALLESLMAQGIVRPGNAWNEAARQEIKRSLESQIDAKAHGEALLTLAKVIAWAGKSEEAFRLSLRAVDLAPTEAAVQFEAGKNAAQLGRFDEAIPHLRRALEINPGFVEAHASLGSTLAEKGDLDTAISHYQQALRLNPEHAEVQCNFGTLLVRQGKPEAAVAHFQEAVRITPTYAEAHNNLAWSLKDLGRFDEALAHFREAVRLKPGLPSPAIGLAWVLATNPDAQKRDPAQAVRLGERLAELSKSRSWMVLDTLAAAYAAAGRYEDAARTARKALDLVGAANPGSAPAVAQRLALYEQKRPYVEAAGARARP